MVGRASTADHARQEPSAQWLVMTLALHRTVFLDGEQRPDDHEVRHDGQTSAAFSGYAAPLRAAGEAGGTSAPGKKKRTKNARPDYVC